MLTSDTIYRDPKRPNVIQCNICRTASKRASTARRTKEDRQREHLKLSFNLTPDILFAMIAKQGGKCANAACGKSLYDTRPCVDHDHACCPGKRSCGKCIRGILCHSCNVALGLARDSQDVLIGLVEYLAAWNKL